MNARGFPGGDRFELPRTGSLVVRLLLARGPVGDEPVIVTDTPPPSHAQSERLRLYLLGGVTLTRKQRRALVALVEEVGALIRVAPRLADVFPPVALASLVGSVSEAHARLLAVTE